MYLYNVEAAIAFDSTESKNKSTVSKIGWSVAISV